MSGEAPDLREAPKIERNTHFVPAGQDVIDQALHDGTPVTSACGKVWIPSRDPDMFPLCQVCLVAITEWWAA